MKGPIWNRNDRLITSSKTLDASRGLSSGSVATQEKTQKILNIKLKNEDDEFDTIGGLILAKVGHVPLSNTKIMIAEELVEVEVLDANARGLKKVKITLVKK